MNKTPETSPITQRKKLRSHANVDQRQGDSDKTAEDSPIHGFLIDTPVGAGPSTQLQVPEPMDTQSEVRDTDSTEVKLKRIDEKIHWFRNTFPGTVRWTKHIDHQTSVLEGMCNELSTSLSLVTKVTPAIRSALMKLNILKKEIQVAAEELKAKASETPKSGTPERRERSLQVSRVLLSRERRSPSTKRTATGEPTNVVQGIQQLVENPPREPADNTIFEDIPGLSAYLRSTEADSQGHVERLDQEIKRINVTLNEAEDAMKKMSESTERTAERMQGYGNRLNGLEKKVIT